MARAAAHQLGVTLGTDRRELAVEVGPDQGDVEDVGVLQRDPQQVLGLVLDVDPAAEPAPAESGASSSLPVATGTPATSTYSRRKTWCEGCEV